MSSEEQDIHRQRIVKQYALILNYNAKVENQHNYFGGKEVDSEEVFVPKELLFFDPIAFGSAEKQKKLIELLDYIARAIDTNSGREWFAVYAGYRYYKSQLAVKGEYTNFFADIEKLLPDRLRKIDVTMTGELRYHKYTVLLGREADSWYMNKGELPPLNELTIWKAHFEGDWNRYEKSCQLIKDFYRRLMQL